MLTSSKTNHDNTVYRKYTKTFSTTVNIRYSVPSHKRVWLQYKPEYTHYVGKSQKYYVPRYNSSTIIVDSEKDVDIKEASERVVSMMGNRYTLPAGTYLWCQDNDYLSKRPPIIRNY